MNAVFTFCDASFLLQVTSLRKDTRRRGQNCSERICHILQVRVPTLTSHLEGHRLHLHRFNSWLNQLFYSRLACISFSLLNRS